MASRNQMRSILLPLKAIAAAQQCAVLLVMHSNKKQGVDVYKRQALIDPKNIALMEEFGVLTKVEMHSRYEVEMEPVSYTHLRANWLLTPQYLWK